MDNAAFTTLSETEAMDVDGGIFGVTIVLTTGAKIALACGAAGIGIGLFAARKWR